MNSSHLSNDEITTICNSTIDEGVNVFMPVLTLRRLVRESETLGRIRAGSFRNHSVDCLGLALELDTASKKVQSQTALRAMEAASRGLKTIHES